MTPVKNTTLRQVSPGRRAKLHDGREVIVSSLVGGDVFCRAVLEDEVEWAPGRFGPRTGELHVAAGDTPVIEVR